MTRKRVKAIDFKAGKPTRWQAYDTYDFEIARDASKRRMTREGFMIAPANISRTGIQEYTARELGLEGTNRTIRLMRPADEVFKAESYSTFERQTITNSHPDGDVSASNYRAVTSGDVHDVAPVGDDLNLGANLYIKDAGTIEYVVTYEKNQLSCGYSFVLDMTPGVAPDGQGYDGVMRDIVGNHVAIVWNARGGPGLRVADQDPTKRKRTMKIIEINGITVEVGDETPESSITTLKREIGTLTKGRDEAVTGQKTAETSLAAGTKAAADAKTAHDAALAEAKAKIPTAEQFAASVAELRKAEDGAKKIIGDGFDAKGKTVADIRLAALDHVLASEGDSTAKTLALTNLAGVAPEKADANIVRLTFDGIVAVATAAGGAGGEAASPFVPKKKVGDASPGDGAGNAKVIKFRAGNLGFGRPAGQA